MGAGPNGSGVIIAKPGELGAVESMTPAERRLHERQERRRRLEEHHARDVAFQEGRPPVETKALEGPPENKMLAGSEETKADGTDLQALSRESLIALAADRSVTVTRADGRTDLEPTKSDYVRALGS